MSLSGLAHGASLPLFSLLMHCEGQPCSQSSQLLKDALQKLQLGAHVQVVIVVGEKTELGFEALSEYGAEVLNELNARSEFMPCPEGECEVDNGSCKWCGALKA